MKNKLLIIFCILLPIFLLLLSYHTTVFFTEKNTAQQEVFTFLDTGSGLEDYTLDEKSHLHDVAQVMTYATLLLIISVLILAGFIYKAKNKAELFKYGGYTTVGSILTILILSITSFSTVFTYFHKIFFPQGNWQFPIDSLLIQTFPIEFFMNISKNIFIQTFIWGILFILLSYYLQHDHRKKGN